MNKIYYEVINTYGKSSGEEVVITGLSLVKSGLL